MKKFLNFEISKWNYTSSHSHFRIIYREDQSYDIIGLTNLLNSEMIDTSESQTFKFFVCCVCFHDYSSPNIECVLIKNLKQCYNLYKYPKTCSVLEIDSFKNNIDNFLIKMDKLKGFL